MSFNSLALMSNRAIKDCVQQAIDAWWPQYESHKGHDFEQRMRMLQADLIRCHVDEMTPDDKRRAIATLN